MFRVPMLRQHSDIIMWMLWQCCSPMLETNNRSTFRQGWSPMLYQHWSPMSYQCWSPVLYRSWSPTLYQHSSSMLYQQWIQHCTDVRPQHCTNVGPQHCTNVHHQYSTSIHPQHCSNVCPKWQLHKNLNFRHIWTSISISTLEHSHLQTFLSKTIYHSSLGHG